MTDRVTSWLLPVGVLALGTFAMGTDSFVLAGILPQIADGLGVAQGAAGQVGTAFAFTYALAAPVLAASTGHFARKPLLIAALLIFIVANLLSALAPNLPLLLAARVLAGIGAALYTPSAYGVAAMLGGEAGRGRAFSIILGGLAVGTVFGVPLGTLIGQQISWRATLVFVALVGALALLGLVVTLPRLALPAAVTIGERLRLIANGRVLTIVAMTTLVTMGGFLIYTYIAPILNATAHISGLVLAGALIGWGVGGSIGAFSSGWLIEKFGDARTSIFAMALVAATLVGIGFASSPWVAIPLLVLNGAGCWGNTTPNNHRLAVLAPAFATVVISYNSSGIYLGQALGAAFGGALLIAHATAVTMCIVGACIVLVAVAMNVAVSRAASVCAE